MLRATIISAKRLKSVKVMRLNIVKTDIHSRSGTLLAQHPIKAMIMADMPDIMKNIWT